MWNIKITQIIMARYINISQERKYIQFLILSSGNVLFTKFLVLVVYILPTDFYQNL